MANGPHGIVTCPILIGRQPELDALRLLLDPHQNGRRSVILVCGEAGIGKSRLVAEVKAHATAHDIQIIQGACFSTDRPLPYAPLLDLFRTYIAAARVAPIPAQLHLFHAELAWLLPELAVRFPELATASPLPASDPEQQKQRLFAVMAHFVAEQASRRPLLLIVEDIHWCDDLSLELLLHLARRCQQAPLFVLVTYRSDELPSQLRSWLTHLDRERLAQEFFLGRLSYTEVAAMLRATLEVGQGDAAELLDTLYTWSEGNPFCVEELLKSLMTAGELEHADGAWRFTGRLAAVPRSIQEAVQQRTAYLSADARRLLTLAAVAGRRFNVTLLRELMQCDEDRLLVLLKELIAAQLVSEEAADRFAFRHALTQHAIYTSLLLRERQALHHTIAETLERFSTSCLPREQHLEDLAYHSYEAGMWEQALAYAQAMGERTLTIYAHQSAIYSLTRALEASHHLSRAPSPRLYLDRGKAYDALGDFEHARGDYEHALAAARKAHDGHMEWQSALALGFLWSGRDYEQAGAWFHQALDLAETLADPLLRARSLNRLGNWLVNIGRCIEGLQAHQDALAIVEAHGDTRDMAETLDLLATAYGLYGNKVQSVQIQGRAIALFRTLEDTQSLASILATRALQLSAESSETVYHPLRTHGECLQDATESLHLAQQTGSLAAQAFAEISLSYACSFSGDLGQAFAHGQEALRIATAIEHRQWMALSAHALADTYVQVLQAAPALAVLERGLLLAHEVSSELLIGTLTALQGQACILKHDLRQAASVLGAVMPREQLPHSLAQRQLARVWGELALAQGDALFALQRADELLASAPGQDHTQPIPHLLRLRGEALATLGRLDEAEQSFTEAQQGAEMRHDQAIIWRIHRALGHLYHRRKCEEQAQNEYRAARRIVAALAASLDDPALKEQFARAALASMPPEKPLSPRTTDKRAFGGLTAREREVAALVAEGKTSREIAGILVLSERTAEVHVSNILGKLGFTSRAQIAVWAVEHGLAKP